MNEAGGIDPNTRYETPIFRAISTQNYARAVNDTDPEGQLSQTNETNRNTVSIDCTFYWKCGKRFNL